jgi:hypothetical protein
VGDEAKLGAQSAAAGRDQRSYDRVHQRPSGSSGFHMPEQSAGVRVGSIRRLARRAALLSAMLATFSALVAWAAILVYGAIWIVHQLPLL